MKKVNIQQLLSFITCLILIAAVSIRRDGKVLGYDINPSKTTETAATNDTLRTLADGTIVISTKWLAKDITGYAGTVPLEISLKITIAIVFVILSTVIMRPYCRFVCPTGTLLKYAQSSFKG